MDEDADLENHQTLLSAYFTNDKLQCFKLEKHVGRETDAVTWRLKYSTLELCVRGSFSGTLYKQYTMTSTMLSQKWTWMIRDLRLMVHSPMRRNGWTV
ncbi:hypothetical protein SUNI508_02018 [Seiridium unicorne]|uniref:Uncharacterized protein n=1 Tax=Seiridium unicorne TaxID=138068 RepID=A0ABR2UL33_9PEZI